MKPGILNVVLNGDSIKEIAKKKQYFAKKICNLTLLLLKTGTLSETMLQRFLWYTSFYYHCFSINLNVLSWNLFEMLANIVCLQ